MSNSRPQLPTQSTSTFSNLDPDTELSKVYSFDKKQDLFNILHSDHPDHYSRLYLAGFLKHVGYSLEEICSIIESEASWSDYDARVTWLHVRSMFRDNHIISTQVPLRGFRGEAPPRGVGGGITRPCSDKWIACSDCPSKCNFVVSDTREK